MKLQTASFYMDLFTNKAFLERLKLKDDAMPTISGLQHISVSDCCYYVVTIARCLLTDRLICTEYLCIFNLNHSSVHLFRM